jgi:transmembrane sensor
VSGASNIRPARKNAEEVETIAAAWLARCEFGNLEESEQAKLDAWLAEAWQHRTAYWRLKVVWAETYRFAAFKRPAREDVSVKPPGRMFSPLRVAAIAAVTIMLAGGAAFLRLNTREQTISTALGAHKTVALAGGSQVELNTSTVLRVVSDRRRVWLDKGEAYFQIRHDAQRPFVVAAAGYRVIDLGTKFVVLNDPGRLKVVLLEGRARLEPVDGNSRAKTLLPGDVAIATTDSVSVTRQNAQEMSKALGWRRGVLVFEHTSLADATSQLNRYNAQKLIVVDSDTAKLTVDGTFPINGVDQFASAAKTVFGVHVARRGNEIVISR